MGRHTRLTAVAVISLFASSFAVLAADSVSPRTLTLEQRIDAQKAIEEVYWRHRIWPKENPGPKPPLSEVMPDAAIRARVEDDLRKDGALETLWGRSISPAELQAELNRITNETHDAATLRELFAALHDEPALIGECLVRPILVDRVLRADYDDDARFGGGDRGRVGRLYGALTSISSMRTAEGRYDETTLRREAETSDPAATERWRALVAGLAGQMGIETATAASAFPVGRIGPLRESDSGFEAIAILSATEKEVRVASVVWDRRTFDAWWQSAASSISPEPAAAIATSLIVPTVPATACTDDSWTPTRQDVPDPRVDHVAVWTGSEMLIWGGGRDSGNLYTLNDGWRYSPATDLWTRMATAPLATRRVHVGVWTGSELIIWGGQNNVQAFADGARYDPTSNTWQSIATTGAPSPRGAATAVWTGTQMIVWGGATSTYLNTGGRYTPSTDSWTPTSTTNAPLGRYQHSAIWAANGINRMIIWGGYNGGAALNTGGRYDPISDTWTATSMTGAPGIRYLHVAVWTGARMVIWGGNLVGSPNNPGWRYDPSADTWQVITALNAPGSGTGRSAVWTGQYVVIWGGALSTVTSRYDPVNDTWSAVSTVNMPENRLNATAVWTGTEMILWGGGTVNTGGRYNPITDTWLRTGTGTTPSPRAILPAVWTGSEMILWSGVESNGPTSTGTRYSPALDTWTPTSLAGAPAARSRHTAVWTGSKMIVWGGLGLGSVYINTGGRYDPGTDSWTDTSTVNAPAARAYHPAVWTGTRMIIWGGANPNDLNTGGTYDPVADVWTSTSVIGAPSARHDHAAVWAGSRMLIWGGFPYSGGSRYDPVSDSWTSMSTTGQPTPQQSPAAVWTGNEMIVWSGGGNSPATNAPARYNPASDAWTTGSTAGAPPAFFGPSSAWTGIELIVWGPSGTLMIGGRYNPSANVWSSTTPVGAPSYRTGNAAAWTGERFFVWGGQPFSSSGGGYCACATPATVYRDVDGDGFGDATKPATGCAGLPPAGYATVSGDCNDADPTIYPGAPQLCDGKNNNCSDPSWPTVPANEANADGDGFRICAGDCNDADASVYPGAPQLCDGKNNNCSDPSWPTVPANEADADGDGFRICQNDCNDANPAIRPNAVDICNGIDDNCNGLVDDDALGVDTDGDGVHNACDNCRTVSNPTQTDSDGDHVGNVCDNCPSTPNASQSDVDGDAIGDACDNCPGAANPSQVDTDADKVGDNCDNCLSEFNPTQSDFNHDGEGDICDVNDGLIYIFGTDDKTYVEWQQETGPSSFNVYTGDLAVLRSSGTYTQAPASNPLASRQCGITDPFAQELLAPTVGQVEFSLVTGITGGVEGSLGTNSAGTPRPNTNPCP